MAGGKWIVVGRDLVCVLFFTGPFVYPLIAHWMENTVCHPPIIRWHTSVVSGAVCGFRVGSAGRLGVPVECVHMSRPNCWCWYTTSTRPLSVVNTDAAGACCGLSNGTFHGPH